MVHRMTVPTASRLALTGLLALLSAASTVAQQQPKDTAARDAEDYALILECRGALWKRTFDDATAAGLNPGAIVVTFDGSKASKARWAGALTITGTENYQPSHDVPAIPVRYECAVDIASRQVRSVTYEAVDDAGQPLAKLPTDIVRDARYVDACRRELDSKVRSDAVDRGITKGGNETEPDATSVTIVRKGATLELSGRGRARLSGDYEWQPMTFSCRYDEQKARVTRASYRIDPGDAVAPLAPDRQRALDLCRGAVGDVIVEDALQRGYRWPRDRLVLELGRFGEFADAGQAIEVSGEGWFKADDSHREPTPITFRCTYDPSRDAVASATFEQKANARAPSGAIASGKTGTLVCESLGGANRTCPAQIRGSVRVIRQISRVPCEAYKNYIYSLSGITVWGGCRAEFEFEAR
jgi:hypothetical protein